MASWRTKAITLATGFGLIGATLAQEVPAIAAPPNVQPANHPVFPLITPPAHVAEVADQFNITFKRGTTTAQREALHNLVGGRAVNRLDSLGVHAVKVDPAQRDAVVRA